MTTRQPATPITNIQPIRSQYVNKGIHDHARCAHSSSGESGFQLYSRKKSPAPVLFRRGLARLKGKGLPASLNLQFRVVKLVPQPVEEWNFITPVKTPGSVFRAHYPSTTSRDSCDAKPTRRADAPACKRRSSCHLIRGCRFERSRNVRLGQAPICLSQSRDSTPIKVRALCELSITSTLF